MTRVFVTGASGFLGSHVVHELRSTGCEVTAMSRRESSDITLAAQGALPELHSVFSFWKSR